MAYAIVIIRSFTESCRTGGEFSWREDPQGIGVWGGATARRLAAAHRLVQAKKLKLDELVTRTYVLDDVNEAMTALEKGEVVRSVLVM
jgi:Zn-dependent alcohol dehydrogenase